MKDLKNCKWTCKMTKKDEVSFYFCMMMSLAVILLTTVSNYMPLVVRILILFGLVSSLYMYCKTSKELKNEEAQKKTEEETTEAATEE